MLQNIDSQYPNTSIGSGSSIRAQTVLTKWKHEVRQIGMSSGLVKT